MSFYKMEPLRDGYVWGTTVGGSTATISIDWTADGLTGAVQIRVVKPNGDVVTDWSDMSGDTLTTGSGTSTYSHALTTSGWVHIETRPKNETSLVSVSRAYVGVGYVVPIFGMSNVAGPLENLSLTNSSSSLGNVSFAMIKQDSQGSGVGDGNAFLQRVNRPGRVPEVQTVMATEWKRHSDIPICFVDLAHHGTGYAQLIDDGNSARSWADLERLMAIVDANACLALIPWWAGGIDNLEDADIFIDTGTGYDHYLRDGSPFPATMEIKFVRPVGTKGTTSTGPYDQSQFFVNDQGIVTRGYVNTQHRIAVQWEQYMDAEGDGHTLSVSLGDVDVDPGSAHPEGQDSLNRVCARLALAAAQGLGMSSADEEPTITDITLVAADQIEVTIDLPNGGTLTTEWAIDGDTVPSGENAVQGFEVWEASDEFPSRSSFTATITDAGLGLGPGRSCFRKTMATGKRARWSSTASKPGAASTMARSR